MGEALKSQVEVECRGLLVLFFDKMACFRQPSFQQPLSRWHLEYFLEIPLKPRQASPGEMRKLFNRNIEMKIAEHESLQINLVGLRKVEQKSTQPWHSVQKQLHTFLHFQNAHRSRYFFFWMADIRYDRLEIALQKIISGNENVGWPCVFLLHLYPLF